VLALLASAAPAQLLFRELRKAHLPARPPEELRLTALPLAADVDSDADLDLLFLSPLQLVINDGAAVFTDETGRRIPSAPSAVDAGAFGDIDGDGDVDVMLLGATQRLLRNDGTGRFADAAPGSLPPLPPIAFDAAFVDVDGDRDLDAVVSGRSTAIVHALLRNDGSGRFTNVTATHMPGSPPWSGTILAADLDRDGDADLVIGGSVLVNGNGTFRDETALRMPPALYGNATAAADFDGDGDLDLLFETWSPNAQTRLLHNDGSGRFEDATAGRVGLGVRDAAAGDLDRDGDQDLLAAASRVLRNDGSGVFVEDGMPRVPERCGAFQARLLDADGDADLDAVVNGPGLLLNDGGASFVDATQEWCPSRAPWARGLQPIDCDGDRDLDLLLLAYTSTTLYLNDGDGRLRASAPSRLPPDLSFLQTGSAASADFDHDGDADLLVAGDINYPGSWLLLNDGRGFFLRAPPGRFQYASRSAIAIAPTDVDGDRDVDVLVANHAQPTALLLNDGRGAFVDATFSHLPLRTDPVAAIAVADLNGDRAPDVFFACISAQPRLWLNDGTGRYIDATTGRLPSEVLFLSSAAAADIDGDGDADIVALGQQQRVFVNDGTGRFIDGTSGRLPTGSFLSRPALLDVDEDRDPDLLAGSGLWLNDGSGRFVDVTPARTAFRAGQLDAQAVGDFDGDGDLDLAVAGPWWPLLLYFNHQRQLTTPLLARLDRGYEIELHARPGAAPPGQVGSIVLGAGRLPVPIPLPPLGLLALDPGALLVPLGSIPIAAPIGRGSLALQLPSAPSLRGAHLNLQAVLLHDPTPAEWRLTNAVLDVVSVR
jgi:hypothetical protein